MHTLLIILAIFIGVIYIGLKILEGIAEFFSDLQESAEKKRKNKLEEAAKEEKLNLALENANLKAVLIPYIKITIPAKEIADLQKLSSDIEQQLSLSIKKLHTLKSLIPAELSYQYEKIKPSHPHPGNNYFFIEQITEILCPNVTSWAEKEKILLEKSCDYPCSYRKIEQLTQYKYFDLISTQIKKSHISYDEKTILNISSIEKVMELFKQEHDQVKNYNNMREKMLFKISELNNQIAEHNQEIKDTLKKILSDYEHSKAKYEESCKTEKEHINSNFDKYQLGIKEGVEYRIDNTIMSILFPHNLPLDWDIEFDEKERIAIVEFQLPDIIHNVPFKTVNHVAKKITKQEHKNITPSIHPAILLRLSYEIHHSDVLSKIALLAINGWVKYDDPKNGLETKAYTASLITKREQIVNLNLQKLNPLVAFNTLKGVSTGNITDIVPIAPVLRFNKKDHRFVEAKAVLQTLDIQTNLATMDWQDFEHLIRELFEKVYAEKGVEVKITQASRDKGVDAIVFNPNPLKGGKYVIQAKRYTNTVDVSAVRDLCAVVTKEGASRGILVTTSKFGADAYEFVKGSPITLLNGSELLGLLEAHGYTFKIDMEEAKLLNRQ